MKHRGNILEKAVRKSGISITKIAEMFKTSQRNMYNIFQDENLSNDDMVRYGKILGYNFAKDLPELIEFFMIREPEGLYEPLKSIESKYYILLEKHVKLIEEFEKLKATNEPILYKKVPKKAAPSEPSAPKVRQKKSTK